MPIYIKYDKEKNILYGSIEGRYVIKEIRQVVKDITESEEFSPDVRTLWDMRKVDFAETDPLLITEAVTIRNESPERRKAKLAFIVDSELGFGMMRMYELLSDASLENVMVFKDYSEGESWLLIK